MPTSIRLDARAQRLLGRLAKRRGQTKSEVVRAAIDALAQESASAPPLGDRETAYDRVVHVIGIADSGGAALSELTGVKFRSLLRARERRPR